MRKGTIWGRWYSKIMIMSNLLSTDVVVSCEYSHKHRADYTTVHYKVHVIICTILILLYVQYYAAHYKRSLYL